MKIALDEDRIIALSKLGLPDTVIAKRMGVPRGRISVIVRKTLGLRHGG